jgi:4,5-DOPA dioxygenase extradiol
MSRLPTVFVSHGSPMLPLEPGSAAPMLRQLGAELPRPRAVVALSPHWMARAPRVGASARPATIHDFSGFDPKLNDLRYPAPGDPELAARVAALLQQQGLAAALEATRGLDHGVWVPLSLMLPAADIPVVPVAMPWPLDAAAAYRYGQAFAPLADSGVLLLGSGSMTHNLYDFRGGEAVGEPVQAYAREFAAWIAATLEAGDLDALLDYRRLAPHAARAHPTDEHLLPLFWALGAAGAAAPARRHAGGVHYGMLSMDSWVFG